MKIKCDLEFLDIMNEEIGIEVEGVRCTCSRCGHSIDSFGTFTKSINRCLVQLNRTCPNSSGAFYFIDDTQG